MKKILSLFVTIALLTASMVSFTGCQNMADIHIDPFEQPELEPKHTVTLPKANAGDMTGDGSMVLEYTTGEEVSIYLFEEKYDHKFIGIVFVDATNTRVVLDVPYTLDYDEEFKSFKVCFTMPDADIILYRIIIESVPANEKSRANYSFSIGLKIIERFKFVYLYYGEKIEITPDWIDNNKLCEPDVPNNYSYYFSVTFKCLDSQLKLLQEYEEYGHRLREYPKNTN
jgi:hypothetical protein